MSAVEMNRKKRISVFCALSISAFIVTLCIGSCDLYKPTPGPVGLFESDATLIALSVAGGALSPDFDPAITDYEVAVPTEYAVIRVLPVASAATSEVTVDGIAVARHYASHEISLALGLNQVEVDVTSPDGTNDETYSLDITRSMLTYEFSHSWGSDVLTGGNLSSPHSLAVDSSNNIYVTDVGTHMVKKYDSTGTLLTSWGERGWDDAQFNHPSGIAVSGTNVYICDRWKNRIKKFTTDGVFIDSFGTWGTGVGEFNSPVGVAADTSGNIYVSDLGQNYRIRLSI